MTKSQENLQETDEGLTLINQPLVSAELPSFSDRLSQQRLSAAPTKALTSNNASRFSMKQAVQRFQRKTVTNLKLKVIEQPPKLKYAALGHIDLTTFDFNKKSLQSYKNPEFAEKSRSVINIPKSFTSMSHESNQLNKPGEETTVR